MAAKRTRDVSISDLRVGMCVIKLDISWFESPFFTNTRVIKDDGDITALIDAGVKTLKIDLDRSQWEEPAKPQSPEPKTPTAEEKPAPVEPVKQPPPAKPQPGPVKADPALNVQKSSLEDEMEAATELRSEIKKTVEGLQEDIEQGKAVETEPMAPLIDNTVSSLARNNQALMSLVHLSRKSKKIADHAFGTFCLVLNLAMARGVSIEEREQLGMAALLHEVGWTQLPLHLIGKRTPYSQVELKLIEKHTDVGTKILERSELPDLTRRVIDEHHERLNGKGYPKGLAADQIHPMTNLLAVVDAYEEKIHQLTDQPGQIPTVAMRSLYKEAEQGYFDAAIVASFISMMGIYPPTTALLLNTGEKAVVVEVHEDKPLRPTIRIHYDSKGHPIRNPMLLDLRNEGDDKNARQIARAIDPSSAGIDPLGCLSQASVAASA